MFSSPVHIIDREEPWIDPSVAAMLSGGVGAMPVIYLDAMEMWHPKSVRTRTRPDGTTYRDLDPDGFAFDFNWHESKNAVLPDPDIYGGDCWCGKWKCPGGGSVMGDERSSDMGEHSTTLQIVLQQCGGRVRIQRNSTSSSPAFAPVMAQPECHYSRDASVRRLMRWHLECQTRCGVFGDDNREVIRGPDLTPRQSAVVVVQADPRSSGTGVIIHPSGRIVLTALHVVTNDDGEWLPFEFMEVHTRGWQPINGEYDGAENVAVIGMAAFERWNGSTRDDWALLITAKDIATGNGHMKLGDDPRVALDGKPMTLGYPIFLPPASKCISGNTLLTHQRARVTRIRNGMMETNFDVCDGQSGSPVFVCPPGPFNCNPGEMGEVIGLLTSIQGTPPEFTGGPSVDGFGADARELIAGILAEL